VGERPALEVAEVAGQPGEVVQPVLGDQSVERFLAVG
jgi:hypothetical protein